MSRAQDRLITICTSVLRAGMTGGEADVRAALLQLDEVSLGRLLATLRNISELAETQRKTVRRVRGHLL
jgi:hypothetical protein